MATATETVQDDEHGLLVVGRGAGGEGRELVVGDKRSSGRE